MDYTTEAVVCARIFWRWMYNAQLWNLCSILFLLWKS